MFPEFKTLQPHRHLTLSGKLNATILFLWIKVGRWILWRFIVLKNSKRSHTRLPTAGLITQNHLNYTAGTYYPKFQWLKNNSLFLTHSKCQLSLHVSCLGALFQVFLTTVPRSTEKPNLEHCQLLKPWNKTFEGCHPAGQCPEVFPITSDQFHWPKPVMWLHPSTNRPISCQQKNQKSLQLKLHLKSKYVFIFLLTEIRKYTS